MYGCYWRSKGSNGSHGSTLLFNFYGLLLLSLINVFLQIAEKKKKFKKEGKVADGAAVPALEEETEEGYTHAVWVMTMKLFADMERRRFL